MGPIRIDTPKPRRRRPRHEVLPVDPRDPGVLREKCLAHGGSWARPWFGHSEGPRPAWASLRLAGRRRMSRIARTLRPTDEGADGPR
jgi:hypothetical protein